jgi:serine/threonine-protein phosphatase 2A regulatory subunit B'
MVYNAMKLFMEVNPQLFDDCSHDYAEQQNNAEQIQRNRQAKWDRLAEMAKNRKNGVLPTLPATTTTGSKVTSPIKQEDSDALSQDSSRRLEQLRLGDDAASGRERRIGTVTSSVC